MNYIDAEIVKNGKSYKISNNELTGTSLEVLSFVVGKVKKRSYFNSIDGRIGRVNYGIEDDSRTIRLTIRTNAYDEHDIAHLRDEIFNLFDGEFYIREMRNNKTVVKYEAIGSNTDDMNLGNSEYVNGKRYYVALLSDFDIADLQKSEFVIEFETVTLPFAESFYTTMQLNNTGFSENEGYGLVDGINTDYDKYSFTSSEFYVWNAGNVDVEPESMYLKITLKGVTSTDILSISNYTNGSVYYHRPPLNNATIVIDGLDVKVNGVNALRDTGLSFLKLSKGRNQFNIKNCIFESIEFDFRFYYK